jgi:hypothetical protein
MRCRDNLKADDTFHPAPERRLPAIDRQRRVRADPLVCGNILGPQLESPSFLICSIGEAVDSETQVRQDLVIDDVVKKDGVRIEGFLRQDDAIIE